MSVEVDSHLAGSRLALANRIRVAASILVDLHQSSVPMDIRIGTRRMRPAPGNQGRRQILEALTDIPLDGNPDEQESRRTTRGLSICITADQKGVTVIEISNPRGGKRAFGETIKRSLDSTDSLAEQVKSFWIGVRDADVAA